MAENITLGTVSTFTNDPSAVAIVNNNSSIIETAFEDCLSRAGNQPNTMQSNLDMNSFNIINLPAPSTVNSPIRLTDLATFQNSPTITISTLPTGGATNSMLVKNSSTDYDAKWTLAPTGLTSLGVTTLTTTTADITGTAVLSGSGSGTTTVQASSTASGTLTLPAVTDTLVSKTTTDTLTNKTYDTAGTGNVFKINGTAISAVTGTGSAVLSTSPSITTPNIGVATGTSLAATGKVTSSSPTAGIGYVTGSGSTVTQSTNKSTAVTINAISGAITMNSASLAGAASVTFTVSNTSVGANDVIIANIGSGSSGTSAADYLISVTGVATNSFKISIYNQGGSKSDSLVINFVVIKGAIS